jgi:hypothetical protein
MRSSYTMNEWNRLFIVAVACWLVVAPLALLSEINRPEQGMADGCRVAAYNNYGSRQPRIRSDMGQYNAELAKCMAAFKEDYVDVFKLGSTLIGKGDSTLAWIGWGVLLIPPAMLWIICWGISRIVCWNAAGFRRRA